MIGGKESIRLPTEAYQNELFQTKDFTDSECTVSLTFVF